MRRVHFCAGLEESNGMAVVARFLAKEQDAQLLDVRDADYRKIRDVDEVWVHSCWTPGVWRACHIALKENKRLVRMMHGNLDPVRLGYHGWKKHLVGFIERFFLRRADVVVATCQAEAEWIHKYEPKVKKIKVTDVKRFFDFNHETHEKEERQHLHLLYLGRRHPLKGVEYLESAVAEIVSECPSAGVEYHKSSPVEHRVASNAFGEEKKRVWEWCDVLVLPTLSENFGLVVAEALERGKRVITTDGAPAWGDGNDYGGRLVYLKGYRDGLPDERVRLLKNAIERLACKPGVRDGYIEDV